MHLGESTDIAFLHACSGPIWPWAKVAKVEKARASVIQNTRERQAELEPHPPFAPVAPIAV